MNILQYTNIITTRSVQVQRKGMHNQQQLQGQETQLANTNTILQTKHYYNPIAE